jgi:hypothetical protein
VSTQSSLVTRYFLVQGLCAAGGRIWELEMIRTLDGDVAFFKKSGSWLSTSKV